MEADLSDEVEFEVNNEVVEVIPTFVEMGLNCDILRGIYNCGFEKPLAFQKYSIKPMILGRDFVGEAPSGMGKTVAYAIAVLQGIDMSVREPQAIILAPDHDVAVQIEKVFLALGQFMEAQCCTCTARTGVDEDIHKLDAGQQIVVGTSTHDFPDLLTGHNLRTRAIRMLVMDEAGDLLSTAFRHQIYNIYHYLPPNSQVVLISANSPPNVLEMSTKFLYNPIKVLVRRYVNCNCTMY